jgi:hypothetical protein
VKELDHKTGETLECARNADSGVHFNQDAFGGMDVDLQLAGFVDGRIKESKETLQSKGIWVSSLIEMAPSGNGIANLMGNVRTGFTDVPVHLAHNANVLITVE